MNVVLEKLKQWDCDIEGALERFLDDEEMYMDFLNVTSEDENLDKLVKSVDEGNAKDAFDYAHTLKGVYGNMGLTPLYQLTIDIVEPLRNENMDGIKEKCQELVGKNEELKALLK